MSTVFVFLALWGAGLFAVLLLRDRLRSLRRFGLGGAEEDLERARSLMRETGLIAVALVCTVIAMIALGERWAGEWRRASTGLWVLDALALGVGAYFIFTVVYSVRQQWSRTGSFGKMALGMLGSVIATGLLILLFHWRWG